MESFADCLSVQHGTTTSRRRRKNSNDREQATYTDQRAIDHQNAMAQWKRIMLLVVAITVHNIPEGKLSSLIHFVTLTHPFYRTFGRSELRSDR